MILGEVVMLYILNIYKQETSRDWIYWRHPFTGRWRIFRGGWFGIPRLL